MRPLLRQIYAANGMFCVLFTHGYFQGIQAIMLASLKAPGSRLQLTIDQESWIPSITVLMIFPSQCLCGFLTHRFGRRRVLAATLLPPALAALLLSVATNFTTLFAASLISGLFGGGMAVGHLFMSEVTEPKHRGMLLSLKQIFGVGAMVPHFLGNYYDYTTLVPYLVIFSIFGIVTTLTSPESPPWLAGNGRFEESEKAFMWYRGNDDNGELKQLIEKQKQIIIETNKHHQKSSLIDSFLDKSFLKALSINVVGLILIDMTGRPVFTVYAIDMINYITNKAVNPHFFALGIDMADLLAVVISCILVTRLTRRQFLLGSGCLSVFLLLIFCLLVYLQSNQIIPSEYSWSSLLVMGVYFLTTGSGVCPIMFTVINEVFPLRFRGLGISLSSFVFAVLIFTGMKLTPRLMGALGIHGLFLINAIVMALCLVYLHRVVPDTTDRPLQEIEDELRGDVTPDAAMDKMLA